MLMGSNHWETSSTSQIYRMMVCLTLVRICLNVHKLVGIRKWKNILSDMMSLGKNLAP